MQSKKLKKPLSGHPAVGVPMRLDYVEDLREHNTHNHGHPSITAGGDAPQLQRWGDQRLAASAMEAGGTPQRPPT